VAKEDREDEDRPKRNSQIIPRSTVTPNVQREHGKQQREYSRGLNYERMKELEFNHDVIRIAEEGYHPNIITHEPSQFENNKSAINHARETSDTIRELLREKRISKCHDAYDINPLTLVIKGEKIRLCIDTSRILNPCIPSRKFKMRGLDHRIKNFKQGNWMGKIDLKNGYLHIPLHKDFKKYVAFNWKGITYQYNWLPFGINDAPRIFQAFANEISLSLLKEGIYVESYLDDFWIEGETESKTNANIKKVFDRLEDLGFTVNKKKSQLTATQNMEYLGMIFDTKEGSIRPKPSRHESAKKKLKEARRHTTARILRRLLGELSHSCTLDQRLKPFLMRAFKQIGNKEREELIHLSKEAWKDLQDAVDILPKISFRTKDSFEKEVCIITSDASKYGCAYWDSVTDTTTSIKWNLNSHATVTELIAAVKAIKERSHPTRLNLLRTDNTSTKAILNQGSSKNSSLNDRVLDLCKWAIKHDVHFTATYLKGELNTRADQGSRNIHKNVEDSKNNFTKRKTPPGDIIYTQLPFLSTNSRSFSEEEISMKNNRNMSENSTKTNGYTSEISTKTTTRSNERNTNEISNKNPAKTHKERSEGRAWELQHEAKYRTTNNNEVNYRYSHEGTQAKIERSTITIKKDVDLQSRLFKLSLSHTTIQNKDEIRKIHSRIMTQEPLLINKLLYGSLEARQLSLAEDWEFKEVSTNNTKDLLTPIIQPNLPTREQGKYYLQIRRNGTIFFFYGHRYEAKTLTRTWKILDQTWDLDKFIFNHLKGSYRYIDLYSDGLSSLDDETEDQINREYLRRRSDITDVL
jgi:hypothetical protein